MNGEVTMPHLRRDGVEQKKLLLHSPPCNSVRLSASGSDKLMQISPERVEIKVSQLFREMKTETEREVRT